MREFFDLREFFQRECQSRRLVFQETHFLFFLSFSSLLAALLAVSREARREERDLKPSTTMARGRGGAGGGGGGGAAAGANAAAKSSTTTATALNVPASALQLLYDLASVDEVRNGGGSCSSRSEGSDGGVDFYGARQEEGGRERHSFFLGAAPACVDSFFFPIPISHLSLRLLPSLAPPFHFFLEHEQN